MGTRAVSRDDGQIRAFDGSHGSGRVVSLKRVKIIYEVADIAEGGTEEEYIDFRQSRTCTDALTRAGSLWYRVPRRGDARRYRWYRG